SPRAGRYDTPSLKIESFKKNYIYLNQSSPTNVIISKADSYKGSSGPSNIKADCIDLKQKAKRYKCYKRSEKLLLLF
ncbi:MAG: hypothetical protein K2K81_03230, partial [Muribaculaceae bacterium]|nr:hypothetical protein [Muribaculaceae bacterium]